MSKKNRSIKYGLGKECSSCGEIMERRKPLEGKIFDKSFYFTEWDFCLNCRRVQHYEEFKKYKDPSTKNLIEENERQQDFFSNLRNKSI